MRARSRAVAADGNEVAPIPGVENADRRERTRLSLASFAETYVHQLVAERDRWAPYHFERIDRLEASALGDQWAAFALPRGSWMRTDAAA